ncbi:MAG: DNA (cytosine-5-)-methyltransferase [Bacteroides sp.]|nr:DNA (cytosine-5-)-methyltransferase [Bacteroides sp.]MCM1531998.1 DNA (cytosine-5-)-methyltransferase [Ruminococcus flavefaciens]MCM1554067.1 DNA (cytosine-5-)-methyltransferase [Bacteroides sp.]
MFLIEQKEKSSYTFLSLFSGAGGLDLGFEKAGFLHIESSDILDVAVRTMQYNRPNWNVLLQDVREYKPQYKNDVDVLLAGFPCQGFSLGGKRDAYDERNSLYRHVIRIAEFVQPRLIVMENVLNLRTMNHPETGKPFAIQIAEELSKIGYTTVFQSFRVSNYGVPQTRRRFIFFAYKNPKFSAFCFPKGEKDTPIKDFLFDIGQDFNISLPNHNPEWGFKSYAHTETGENFDSNEIAVPVRFSRTASEGNPIRDFNSPFPAVDTATVWGWAQGHVTAKRIQKDRTDELYVRNPESCAKLWRISASRLRAFTAREYARLQTFPDDWVFIGENKRDVQLQIGNAVPVLFAKKIAISVREILEFVDNKRNSIQTPEQPSLFQFTDFI